MLGSIPRDVIAYCSLFGGFPKSGKILPAPMVWRVMEKQGHVLKVVDTQVEGGLAS